MNRPSDTAASVPAGLLAKVIEEQGISKRSLIAHMKIDRSSFYQMLRGIRPGTADQFAAILSQLSLTPELTEQLIREYMQRRFGSDYVLFEQVDQWIQKLTNTDQAFPSASKVLHACPKATETLRQMIEAEINRKDSSGFLLYVPVDLFSVLWMKTDILNLLDALAQTRQVRILISVNLDGEGSLENRLALLFSFLYGLYHVRNFSEIVTCSYISQEYHDTPYPYFAASGRCVCLMTEDFSESILLRQRKAVAQYFSFFTRFAEQAYEYLENYDSLEGFMKSLQERFLVNAGEGKVNRMAERSLCIFKTADSSQISRYADPETREFLLSYRKLFLQMQSIFLNSSSAVRQLSQECCIMENGIRIMLDPEDAEKLRRAAEESDREDLLLLTGEQDHLPQNWTFSLFSTGELVILPNWDYQWILSIHNRELTHAFSIWFDCSLETALVRKKLAAAGERETFLT